MNAIENNSNTGASNKQDMLNDLPDSEHDQELLKGDKAIFEMPEVKDIPGQEFIHVMPLGEMADTTISSADEEGEGVLDDEEEEDYDETGNGEEDISAQELELLDQHSPQMEDSDSENLRRSKLDNTDWDGEALNEVDNVDNIDGTELDVPGAELDDENEELGEEDEENNLYSEADTD